MNNSNYIMTILGTINMNVLLGKSSSSFILGNSKLYKLHFMNFRHIPTEYAEKHDIEAGLHDAFLCKLEFYNEHHYQELMGNHPRDKFYNIYWKTTEIKDYLSGAITVYVHPEKIVGPYENYKKLLDEPEDLISSKFRIK